RLSNPAFVTPPDPDPDSDTGITVALSPFDTTTVSIVDNEAQFNFNQAAYTVNEGVGTLLVPVTRKLNTTTPASVDYSTSNLSAIGGQDYTVLNGTLTFAANETTKSIAVPIINDPSDEDAESFRVTLSNGVGGQVGPTSTTIITITDDDDIPSVTIADVSQVEGNFGTSEFSGNTRIFQAPVPTDVANVAVPDNQPTAVVLNPNLSGTPYGLTANVTTSTANTIVSYTISAPSAGGTLYYNNVAVTGSTVIPAGNLSGLTFLPTRGFIGNVTFTYTALDANGQASTQHNNGGTATLL
ncbi:MAG: hypothetical protein EOO39_49630, partial [Cytophagaceae bacterium]